MLGLALAEKIEGQGRFTDKLINVIWHILEETTWVLPAHNQKRKGLVPALSYAYEEQVDYIDLFAATTGASLAMVYHLCKDSLDSVTEIVSQRIKYELTRRIIKPYINDAYMWELSLWSGIRGNGVNNWNPWIVSNVLTVCALVCEDLNLRELIVSKSIRYLDNFLVLCSDDGACDEGPAYWNVSGGALFNAGLVLYDMTKGHINLFKDDYMRKNGEFAVRTVISTDRVMNYADAAATTMPLPVLVYQWGQLCGSEEMISYGSYMMAGRLPESRLNDYLCYRSLRFLTQGVVKPDKYKPRKFFYYNKLGICGMRQYEALDKGLYLSLKGGSNAEGHNHNDVGSFIIFTDGKPLFIDAGCGQYTKKTFGPLRYTIWSMRSDYHNCASFNGVAQCDGLNTRATEYKYDDKTGSFCFDLTKAYPEEAGLVEYKRGAVINGNRIEVTDYVRFSQPGSVTFNLITLYQPEQVWEKGFRIVDRTIEFDPILEYHIEEIDVSSPETTKIPIYWKTDKLYRITLTTSSPIDDRIFIFTVE